MDRVPFLLSRQTTRICVIVTSIQLYLADHVYEFFVCTGLNKKIEYLLSGFFRTQASGRFSDNIDGLLLWPAKQKIFPSCSAL